MSQELGFAARNKPLLREQLQERARGILAGPLGCVRAEDHAFLVALIARHPNADSKIGTGIDHFEIRLNRFNSPTFWVVRQDGSDTDFSYRQCLTGAPTHRAQVLTALRAAIAPQMIEFKKRNLIAGARCAISNAELDQTCHVDHDPPFIDLATVFVERCGGFESIQVTDAKDGAIGRFLVSGITEHRWCEFHRQAARLSLVTPAANIAKSAQRLDPHAMAKLAVHLRTQFEFISGAWP